MRQGSQPTAPPASRPARAQMQALRADLLDADDAKIRQIVALLEASAEPGVRQAVLEPLRPRLTSLKPPRALRFTRLLFMPLDGLIVPALGWKPSQATIPRSALEVISRTVQAALDSDITVIETIIAGHHTDAAEVVTRAGAIAWGRAAEILARAPSPVGWADIGLPPALYAPLARGIATVLRTAGALRSLERDAELGVLQPDEQVIREIIANLGGEPAEGCTMVCKLLLRRLPHMIPLLRQLIGAGATAVDRAVLQAAMDQGTDALLADMEDRSDLTEGLREGVFSAVGAEVQRITRLLQDIDQDAGAARHRPRLMGIRKKLDEVCRGRFAEGITKGLVAPLTGASGGIDNAGQMQLESFARDLRTIETAGRKLGSPAAYDTLIVKASEAVQAAAQHGSLAKLGAVRLVEILAGPEMAEALYRKNAAPAARVA